MKHGLKTETLGSKLKQGFKTETLGSKLNYSSKLKHWSQKWNIGWKLKHWAQNWKIGFKSETWVQNWNIGFKTETLVKTETLGSKLKHGFKIETLGSKLKQGLKTETLASKLKHGLKTETSVQKWNIVKTQGLDTKPTSWDRFQRSWDRLHLLWNNYRIKEIHSYLYRLFRLNFLERSTCQQSDVTISGVWWQKNTEKMFKRLLRPLPARWCHNPSTKHSYKWSRIVSIEVTVKPELGFVRVRNRVRLPKPSRAIRRGVRRELVRN